MSRKSNKKSKSKRKCIKATKSIEEEEVGIPTVWTPVPSSESLVIADQKRRNFKTPRKVSSSFEMENSGSSEDSNLDLRKLTRLTFVRVYFMQDFFISFELATDRTLLTLLRYVLEGISVQIRNQFSFYAYASPFDIIWKRPSCELMKKPAMPTSFRKILMPAQRNLTLAEIFKEIRTEGTENLNVYIFVKDLEDKFDESEEVDKRSATWKYQMVLKGKT